MNERDYWNAVFAKDDPWSYSSAYEQTKYRHTLELMPDTRVQSAVEIGCAEGMFTNLLAPRVEQLVAVDLSDVALDRARARCAGHDNVRFLQHNIGEGMIGADLDLVVCSEVLYYLRDGAAIQETAVQIEKSLRPGGHLLMTHANMVSDDRGQTGFDFNEIGAKYIATAFGSTSGLEFLRELRTEFYRVQLFRRLSCVQNRGGREVTGTSVPREVIVRKSIEIDGLPIKWGGCAITAAEARHCWITCEVPILMYHRIASDGPPELAPYRVSSENFERQLAWLQRQGFHGITLEQFGALWFTRNLRKLPGKPVVLTFDDGYADFYHEAWPLLRHYGFSATVFLPTDYVGGSAEWDSMYGPPAQIMSWSQILELSRQGARFGSHSRCHRRMTTLSHAEVLTDAIESRAILTERLGAEISEYCYPYAFADLESRRLIAEAGYKYAVCGLGGNPPDHDDPFYIPRIEIFGTDRIEDFIAKLPETQESDEATRLKFEELRLRRDRATYMSG